MRNKSNIKIIILVLGIIFALSTYSNWIIINKQLNNDLPVEFRNEESLKTPKSSGYWSTNFIHIDDNWTDTTSYDWCSGDGSFSNPYTIENVTIDASSSPTGSGIFINNSKKEFFIIRNCSVTNAQDGIRLESTDNGTLIYNNCSNNNGRGILLLSNCKNNTISNNIVNENSGVGIGLQSQCDNNTINGNIATKQNIGIRLINGCDENIISGNTANDNSQYGMLLEDQCHNNIISGNTANDNSQHGIFLQSGCDYNTILANTAINNQEYGIVLSFGCDDNIISGNSVNNNDISGIRLMNCDDNTISGNTVYDNSEHGIYFFHDCYNNIISENIIYENKLGIAIEFGSSGNIIYYNCLYINSDNNAIEEFTNYWDNGAFGNYWSDYTGIDANLDGIGDSAYDIPGSGSGKDNRPLMNYKPFFIEIPEDMSYEIESIGNILKWTVFDISPYLESYNISRDGIPIINGTLNEVQSDILINIDGLDEGTYLFTLEIHDGYGATDWNNVWVTVRNTAPEFTVKPDDLSYEVGEEGNILSWTFSDVSINNPNYTIFRNGVPIIINNPCASGVPIEILVDGLKIDPYWFTIEINDGYGETALDNVWITVINSNPVFTSKPDDFSYEVGEVGNNLSWTFSDVSTNNPNYTIFRNGIPIIIDNPCVSGVPIVITVDDLEIGSYGFTIEVNDGYGETALDSVWVSVKSGINLLYVEIVNQAFSIEEFNITLVVYNESGQGIDSGIVQLWWNGTDVSSDIQTLGNGLFFIALEPITVEPGENPILLEMEISAPGYQDKSFNTYLAVDPDTLEKGLGGAPDNLPFIITITIISSIAGAIGVAATTLLITRKRKRVS